MVGTIQYYYMVNSEQLLNVEIDSERKSFSSLTLKVKDSIYRAEKIVIHAVVEKKD